MAVDQIYLSVVCGQRKIDIISFQPLYLVGSMGKRKGGAREGGHQPRDALSQGQSKREDAHEGHVEEPVGQPITCPFQSRLVGIT